MGRRLKIDNIHKPAQIEPPYPVFDALKSDDVMLTGYAEI